MHPTTEVVNHFRSLDGKERDVYTMALPLTQIQEVISNILDENEEWNIANPRADGFRLTKDSKLIKDLFTCITNIEKASDQKKFSMVFEYVIKFRLIFATSNETCTFVRETELNSLLLVYSQKIMNACFLHLEKMEEICFDAASELLMSMPFIELE